MNKIALAMIVKGTDDEATYLDKCLSSVYNHVDAIYLNINHRKGEKVSSKLEKIAKSYSKNIYITEWQDSFVDARNFIYNKVSKKYDWILWLDADDTVKNPSKIKDIISAVDSTVKGIYLQYDYAHDEYGNCTVSHWICRISKNDGSFRWESSIRDKGVSVHETLTATRTINKVRNNEMRVIHGSNEERRNKSLLRNIKLLEGMYERQVARKEVDPRTLYYLATHYFDAGRYNETQSLLMEYLKASGWAEERAEAWVYMGLTFETPELYNLDASRQCFTKAIAENPKNPRPYVELGQLEFYDKRYNISEEWLLMAIDKRPQETAFIVLPMENKYRAYMLLSQTYINMGFSKLKDAKKYIEKALKLRPQDQDAKNAQELIVKLTKVRRTTQAIINLARTFNEEKHPENILPVLDSLPAEYQDNPAVITIRQKYTRPKKWGKNTVAIFCGNSAEDIWGPWGLEEGGMGGSEEAVIQLSNQLTELGWGVTVYATPGSRAGNYDGVEWKQFWEFNPKDVFDVFIAWRSPWFFDVKIKARRNYLWLHDVMDKGEFTPERLANIDNVIFVSQYHADLYKDVIPDDKRFASGNGIDQDLFKSLQDKYKRNPYRCLYMSSHLRGLELLYEIWPDVKKEVPEATLDVYYGWKTYDNANRDNPERMKWRDKMVKLASDLPGVTDHDRADHITIAQEINKASILAYPCTFPEVYCITLVKSMAGGLYPITSDYAVLKDFNTIGTQVHLDKDNLDKFKKDYKKELIKTLKNRPTIKQSDINKIRQDFSWKKTAEGWNKLFRG